MKNKECAFTRKGYLGSNSWRLQLKILLKIEGGVPVNGKTLEK